MQKPLSFDTLWDAEAIWFCHIVVLQGSDSPCMDMVRIDSLVTLKIAPTALHILTRLSLCLSTVILGW